MKNKVYKYIIIYISICLFVVGCDNIGNNPVGSASYTKSPLLKYQKYPYKRVISWDVERASFIICRSNFCVKEGIVSNNESIFIGINYRYENMNKEPYQIFVYHYTNDHYERTIAELDGQCHYVHANLRYTAFQKGDILYIIDTNKTTNWTRDVKYKSYILKFASDTSPLFVYGEFYLNKQNVDEGKSYFQTEIQHPIYLYNIDTKESNYIGLAQDVLCFSPKNSLLFFNLFEHIANAYYWGGNTYEFLTNSGMLAVYHLKDKSTKIIGDFSIATNAVSTFFSDQILGITADFTRFYVYDVVDIYAPVFFSKEVNARVSNGVWEIDISSLGLKDE